MGKGCINGVLDDTKYSSPVPFIGLYIAAGSAVCMLFMLFDIISAFRRRKTRWIPCLLFSLNSLTLTLLAISSKIPVDLTTPMPGAYDQLSKLTGTTLICVSMGFFYPSLAEQSDSEFLTNIISLTVFVITVVVNISIQISTGVIYLFIKEHIIIMVCMCVLLFLLWDNTKDSKRFSEFHLDSNKDLIIKGGSLLQRLKLCYLYGFNANPQLRASNNWASDLIFLCCLISFGTLVQAAFRSVIMKQLKTCQGNSDYEWSMWMIALFQILTILIGCSAITFRWLSYWAGARMGRSYERSTSKELDSIISENPILRNPSRDWFRWLYWVYLPIVILMFLGFLLISILLAVAFTLCCNCLEKRDEKLVLTEYEDLLQRDDDDGGLLRWIVYKASNDMNRLMNVSKSKGADHLSELLSRTNPSLELHAKRSLKDLYPVDEIGVEVSSLSMALLVRIASVTLPSHLSKSLENSFDEAHEIIDFVETRINSATYKAKMKTKLAKAVMLGYGFAYRVSKIRERPEYAPEFESQSEDSVLKCACIVLRELKSTLPPDVIAEEVGAITNVILHQDHQTAQDLYNYIEQMFVDMMHLFLVQFPNAIYKDTGSSAKEFENRVECALKLLWRIELLENKVNWLFPSGTDISSLVAVAVPPDVTEGVSVDGSSPTEGIELQACATVSDHPDGLSTVEDEATQLSEIVVIQDE